MSFLWSPAPNTFLKNIKKCEAGHAMLIKNNKIYKKWRYYDIPYEGKYTKNSELEISSHYISRKPTNSYTLPNSRSMEVKYHMSISQVLKNNYTPRKVDDRIGYFSTIYQDYTNTLQETQYIRYIFQKLLWFVFVLYYFKYRGLFLTKLW